MSLRLEREEDVIEVIKKSTNAIGYGYPCVVDEDTGEVVDGYHRKRADPNWPEIKRKFKDEIERLIFRIVVNTARRSVSKKERKAEMIKLASLLEKRGVPKEQICQKICELLKNSFSERYIRSLLPSKYKESRKVRRQKTVWEVHGEEVKEKKKKEPRVVSKPKKLMCPVCGAALAFLGDMLVPYHEALKGR